jgi:AraC-like DNA-binding protein
MTALFQPFPMLPGRRAQAWRYDPAFRRPRHFHEEPEINIVTRGSARLGVGDQEVSVQAGDVLLFQPGQDHVLETASADFDLFVVGLTPALTARVAGTLPAATGCTLRWSEDVLLAAAAELAASNELVDTTTIEQRLGDLFQRVNAQLARMPALSRRALRGLVTEPSLGGEALASRLTVPASTMSRGFHRDVGVRFVEYRARLRLMRFIDLVDRGASFTRAAHEADFGSYAQCHRIFQQATGCSPKAYFAGARKRVDDTMSA